jgi:hypothetical protein
MFRRIPKKDDNQRKNKYDVLNHLYLVQMKNFLTAM